MCSASGRCASSSGWSRRRNARCPRGRINRDVVAIVDGKKRPRSRRKIAHYADAEAVRQQPSRCGGILRRRNKISRRRRGTPNVTAAFFCGFSARVRDAHTKEATWVRLFCRCSVRSAMDNPSRLQSSPPPPKTQLNNVFQIEYIIFVFARNIQNSRQTPAKGVTARIRGCNRYQGTTNSCTANNKELWGGHQHNFNYHHRRRSFGSHSDDTLGPTGVRHHLHGHDRQPAIRLDALRQSHRRTNHWGTAEIQVAFTIFVATETWLVPVEGWFVDRFGPRLVVMFGGVSWRSPGRSTRSRRRCRCCTSRRPSRGVGAGAVYGTCVGNALKWFRIGAASPPD